jgi:hypothetical protein
MGTDRLHQHRSTCAGKGQRRWAAASGKKSPGCVAKSGRLEDRDAASLQAAPPMAITPKPTARPLPLALPRAPRAGEVPPRCAYGIGRGSARAASRCSPLAPAVRRAELSESEKPSNERVWAFGDPEDAKRVDCRGSNENYGNEPPSQAGKRALRLVLRVGHWDFPFISSWSAEVPSQGGYSNRSCRWQQR